MWVCEWGRRGGWRDPPTSKGSSLQSGGPSWPLPRGGPAPGAAWGREDGRGTEEELRAFSAPFCVRRGRPRRQAAQAGVQKRFRVGAPGAEISWYEAAPYTHTQTAVSRCQASADVGVAPLPALERRGRLRCQRLGCQERQASLLLLSLLPKCSRPDRIYDCFKKE